LVFNIFEKISFLQRVQRLKVRKAFVRTAVEDHGVAAVVYLC
jgi:hypothetical protein